MSSTISCSSANGSTLAQDTKDGGTGILAVQAHVIDFESIVMGVQCLLGDVLPWLPSECLVNGSDVQCAASNPCPV